MELYVYILILILILIILLILPLKKSEKSEKFENVEVIFNNDNNVKVIIPATFNSSDYIPNYYAIRPNSEKNFRKICNYLIINNIIKNNIIDLGAWIGDNTIPWAMNIKGIVYAIDPSEENCNFIKEVANINNVNNVKIIKTGVSDKNEVLSTNDELGHASFNSDENSTNKITAVSLDYLYGQNEINNIDFMHLDVEGMEYKVLAGSNDIIDKYRPIITFEQHIQTEDYNIIFTFLTERKYKIFLLEEICGRSDCRNSFAFPEEIYNDKIYKDIVDIVGKDKFMLKI
jgi:FkbM family methyltransferase